ncbi:MAG: hypothetical protein M1136_09250 [Chloroflexi bacterium]|nr:hypothetical protein [Chloroflexota bacterium]
MANKDRYRDWPGEKEPFFPNEVTYMALVVLCVLMIYAFIVFFIPWPFLAAGEPANPLVTPEHIKPEWYFLASYQALKLFPSELIGIGVQVVAVLALLTLPFWDRSKEANMRKRPLLLAMAALAMVVGIALTIWGMIS